jgi:nicotinamidase-related amidase
LTHYNAALLPAITEYRQSWPARKFGLLIIDEQGPDRQEGELVNAILSTIAYAAEKQFKIVTIEINPSMDHNRALRTRAAFRAIMGAHTVLYKKQFNAFGVIDGTGDGKRPTRTESSLLDAELRNAGIGELIVLGRMAGQCVKNTVLGGSETPASKPDALVARPASPSLQGAVDLGYQVWTSPKIIEGDASSWTGGKGIKCYATVA